MADLVKAKVLKPHRNDFGDKRAKARGTSYSLPASAAVLLEKQGLIELDSQPAATTE